MALSTISSPGGARDCVYDCTDLLETSEVLVTAVYQSSVTGLDVDANGVVLAAAVTEDGTTVQAGKGFSFSIATTVEQDARVEMVFLCTGDGGTSERVSIPLRIKPTVS